MVLATALLFGACQQELDPNEPGNLVPMTVDQDPSLPAIVLNGTQIHAETFGHPDSAIIIVVHGGPGCDYRSMLNCKALADDGYFVVFYDQRGSGLSQRQPQESYDSHTMRDDLAALIQRYRNRPEQKVFLLGHSWGAMLATSYINEYPDQIAGAVLAEPGGFTWDDTRAFIERTRAVPIFSEEASDAFYYDQVFTGRENQHEKLDYKMLLYSAAETAEGNITGIAGPFPLWRKGAVVSNAMYELAQRDGFDWTGNLHLFDTKVLFLYSEFNTAYGLQHAQRVSSAYPNVQLEQVNGSGHEMAHFGWNSFYPLVLNYFNNLK